MGTVATENSVHAVADLEARERDAAGAVDRNRIALATAVDDRRVHALQGDAVGANHDRAGADASEADGAVVVAIVIRTSPAIPMVVDRVGERPAAAIQQSVFVREGSGCRTDDTQRENDY